MWSFPEGIHAVVSKPPIETAEWTGFASIEEGILLSIESVSAIDNLSPFEMTFQFTRDVTGFTINDIGFEQATLSNFTGSGSRYTVQVTPTTCDGVIEITVPDDVAEYTSNFASLIASATVAVNAIPTKPAISSPVEYCTKDDATVLTATGDNLIWYNSATEVTGTSKAPTPRTTNVGTTSFYVSQTTDGCESGRAEIEVNVEACPAQREIGDVFTVSGIDYKITSVNRRNVAVIGISDTYRSGRSSETQTIGITIPETVTYNEITYIVTTIGANAFRNNPNIVAVAVLAIRPMVLREDAFANRSQIYLIVPRGTKQAYLDYGWDGFRSITEEGDQLQVLSAESNYEVNDFYPLS